MGHTIFYSASNGTYSVKEHGTPRTDGGKVVVCGVEYRDESILSLSVCTFDYLLELTYATIEKSLKVQHCIVKSDDSPSNNVQFDFRCHLELSILSSDGSSLSREDRNDRGLSILQVRSLKLI